MSLTAAQIHRGIQRRIDAARKQLDEVRQIRLACNVDLGSGEICDLERLEILIAALKDSRRDAA